MNRRLLALLLLATVVLSTVPAPVAAAEDPRFETTVPSPRLTPGAEQPVTIHLVNDADEADDRVATATNVQVEAVSGDTPFEVVSGPQRLGSMPDGVPTPVTITLTVPRDAEAGTYRLPLRVTYEYDHDERETTTVVAQVRVPEHPVFEVTDVASSVSIAERGFVTVTMTNNGSATAYDTTLAIQTQNPALAVERAQSATQYAGTWAPNESRTFTFEVAASEAAAVREYALSIVPSYETDDGVSRSVAPLSIGVTPVARQSFALEDVSVERYTETAVTLRATLHNTGNRSVENALVRLTSSSPGVTVVEPTAAAGTLDAGGSVPVEFDVRVSPNAAPGPRQFAATVQYERVSGRTYRSETILITHSIATDAEVLSFVAVNNTLAVDESNPIVVRVTNHGEQTLTDLRARIVVQPPYESDSPTSFVPKLAPGESATFRFEVTTPSDAVETRDAIPIVVNASAPGNRAVTAGPTLVPVVVSSAEGPTGSTTNLIAGVVAVALVLAAGWWWLNR
ncbi:MAG: COG1361 S-layer family protein [Halanaeroarchaeum sp.]